MKLFQAFTLALFLVFSSQFVTAAPVDINTANAMAIANSMKGVGIKKAEAIVAYRKKNGNFKSIDELSKVKGIGKKTVAKNRKNIEIKNSR
ncbi:MAG: ComEA family DNA-binding protein [Acidiferrobacterales bacterium]